MSRRSRWSGWMQTPSGIAMHVQASGPLSEAARAALFDVAEAVVQQWRRNEVAAGTWEDDGGPPHPDERRRLTSLLPPSTAMRKPPRGLDSTRGGLNPGGSR